MEYQGSEEGGSPPVANVVVVGGQSIDARLEDGRVTFNLRSLLPFVRGDCNDDGIRPCRTPCD